MTPEQFVYWLQGYSELTGKVPDEHQWRSVQDHLQSVFEKETGPVYPKLSESILKLGELKTSEIKC